MATPSAAIVSLELAEAALSCTALARARRLAEWVGAGRTLTTSGVLRPAEAAQACRDLGIDLPGPRLRSALDVDELMRDWLTAVAAGFVEIDGRRAWVAPDLHDAELSAHPDRGSILNAWARTAATVLELGEDPCSGCLTVLHELHAAGNPITMARLAAAVTAVLKPEEPKGTPCPGCGEVHDPADLPGLGDLILDEDEDDQDSAGHAAGAVAGLLAFGAASAEDGTVRLTPLGIMLAASVFQRHAPSPDADAATVVDVISELPPPVARTVAGPWLGARSPADAVRELFAFAESAGGGPRAAALAFAREAGPEAADAWREWAKRPGAGAYARQWLRSQGEEVGADPADEAWLAVDALSIMLDALADAVPPILLQAMLAQQARQEVTEAAALMLESGHPAAPEVVARLTGRPEPMTRPGRQPTKPGGTVYQLKITLRGVSKPPVWRRVLVPSGITLRDLHEVILRVMGWDGGHLHVFSTGRREYGSPDPELGHASDQKARLSQLLTGPGDRLRYTYDFGDDWEHDIVLEETRPAVPKENYPACVAGKGACPPEDCGGAWGYASLKEILADPSHEEHQDMLDWQGLDAGEDFDPKEFSAAEVNVRLSQLAKTR